MSSENVVKSPSKVKSEKSVNHGCHNDIKTDQWKFDLSRFHARKNGAIINKEC